MGIKLFNKIVGFLFRKKLYFSLVTIMSIVLVFISRHYNLDTLFINYYNINFSSINNSFISFFGVLFAFLFTIMSILFSINKDSLFMELMEKTDRTKKDIVSYFTLSLVAFSIVIIICLLSTIIGGGILASLIYILYYAFIFSLINLITFLTTFILILLG